MSGLWCNREDTPEGKYLVLRRDGSVPEWPWFVLGADDPAAPAALHSYANEAQHAGMDPQYIEDIHVLAEEWAARQRQTGVVTAPYLPPPLDMEEDPDVIEKMRLGGGSA
jgi:hypothetical protein